MRTVTFILTLTASAAWAQTDAPRITAASAHEHVGERVTGCGVIAFVSCDGRGATLHLAAARAGDTRLNLVLVGLTGEALGRRPDRFAGFSVCGTGIVEKTDNGYALALSGDRLVNVLEKAAPADSFTFAPDAVNACTPGVVWPTLTRSAMPNYTSGTLAAGVQGIVTLHGVVLPNGRMGPVRVVSSLHRELDAEAVKAFGRFRFKPGTFKGVPAPIVVRGEIEFTIRDRPGGPALTR